MPRIRTVVVAIFYLVAVISLSGSLAGSLLFNNNNLKSPGTLNTFCPEFIDWLHSPYSDKGTAESGQHGFGLIPAPVSLVQQPVNNAAITQNKNHVTSPMLQQSKSLTVRNARLYCLV